MLSILKGRFTFADWYWPDATIPAASPKLNSLAIWGKDPWVSIEMNFWVPLRVKNILFQNKSLFKHLKTLYVGWLIKILQHFDH